MSGETLIGPDAQDRVKDRGHKHDLVAMTLSTASCVAPRRLRRSPLGKLPSDEAPDLAHEITNRERRVTGRQRSPADVDGPTTADGR
jgi:hypothetical protein